MCTFAKNAEMDEKSTLYLIEVNYIQLKRDLEKNKNSKQLEILTSLFFVN